MKRIESEFSALGVKVSIQKKNKTTKTNVELAFLKSDTIWKELVIKDILPNDSVKMRPSIKIKIEVDTTPPPGFSTE